MRPPPSTHEASPPSSHAVTLADTWSPGRLDALPAHNIAFALSACFCGLLAIALLVLGAQSLPGGLLLFIPALLLLGWTRLALRARAANRRGRPHPSQTELRPAQVKARYPDPKHAARWCVHLHLHPEQIFTATPGVAASNRTLEDAAMCEVVVDDLPAWVMPRFAPQRWICVLTDPADAHRPSIFPPPGGGGVLDVIGDLFVGLLDRATASTLPPAQDPPTSAPPSTP